MKKTFLCRSYLLPEAPTKYPIVPHALSFSLFPASFFIRHLHISHNAPYLPPPPPPILHNLCFSFLLGDTAAPREIENNAYVKFRWQIRCIMGDGQVMYRLKKASTEETDDEH